MAWSSSPIEDESAVAKYYRLAKGVRAGRPIVLGARYISVAARCSRNRRHPRRRRPRWKISRPWLAQLADHGAEIDNLVRADEVRRYVEEDPAKLGPMAAGSQLAACSRMPELAGVSTSPPAARRMRRHVASPAQG